MLIGKFGMFARLLPPLAFLLRRCRDEELARLVAFADDGRLRLATVAADYLRPGQLDKLADAQAAEVGNLEQLPIPAKAGSADRHSDLELAQDALQAPTSVPCRVESPLAERHRSGQFKPTGEANTRVM